MYSRTNSTIYVLIPRKSHDLAAVAKDFWSSYPGFLITSYAAVLVAHWKSLGLDQPLSELSISLGGRHQSQRDTVAQQRYKFEGRLTSLHRCSIPMHSCAESDLQLPCQHRTTGWINNYGSHKCLLGGLRGEKKISTVAHEELIF